MYQCNLNILTVQNLLVYFTVKHKTKCHLVKNSLESYKKI